MANYAFQGMCYGTSASALEAFQTVFPKIENGRIVSHVSSSITGNTITYQLYQRSIGNDYYNVNDTGSLTLAQCSEPSLPYDYTGAAAIWGYFFTVVLSLYLVAKVAGMMINAVRQA